MLLRRTEAPVCVHIRPVELHDAAILQHTCWPDRAIEDVVDFLQRIQKLRAHKRAFAVVAQHDDTVCGFGLLTVWPRAAEISDLIVAPDLRGRGIGSIIIGYLTDIARDSHVSVLEIGVALSNPRALALYRRLGFRDCRTVQLELGVGPEPVLYLEKTLPDSSPDR